MRERHDASPRDGAPFWSTLLRFIYGLVVGLLVGHFVASPYIVGGVQVTLEGLGVPMSNEAVKITQMAVSLALGIFGGLGLTQTRTADGSTIPGANARDSVRRGY